MLAEHDDFIAEHVRSPMRSAFSVGELLLRESTLDVHARPFFQVRPNDIGELAQLIELRFFAGLSIPETAKALATSEAKASISQDFDRGHILNSLEFAHRRCCSKMSSDSLGGLSDLAFQKDLELKSLAGLIQK